MVSSASLTNYETSKYQTNTLPQNSGSTKNAPSSFNNKFNSNSNMTLNRNAMTVKRNSFNASSYYSRYDSFANFPSSNKFNISVLNNPSEFYFRNLLHYIRSGNVDNYNEKLQFIKDQCPILASKSSTSSSSTHSSSNLFQQHGHHNFTHIKLTERSRSALIALLILIIENHHLRNKLRPNESEGQKSQKETGQLNPELMNYLLVIMEHLPHVKWLDDHLMSSAGSKNSKNFQLNNFKSYDLK